MTTDRPFVIDVEEAGTDPALAPNIPEPVQGGALQTTARLMASRRRSPLGRFATWAFGAFAGFVLSVAAWDFITSLLASNTILGTVGLILLGAALLAAVLLALREGLAFARLSRLDDLRGAVTRAATLSEARQASDRLRRFYANRPDLAWPLQRLAEARTDLFDHDAILRLTETEVMTPLDAAARAEVEAAARQVATITALVPIALADVAAALFANLRMIRRIAEIYGGRAGTFGSLRLLRSVFAHLVATGAVALTDDLIGSVAGGGLLSKLSRRFGEGVVNGALTARVGIAAMELCRPMPFAALPRPGVTETLRRALTGLFDRTDPESPV